MKESFLENNLFSLLKICLQFSKYMNQANKIKMNRSNLCAKVSVMICRLCDIVVIVCMLISIVTCVLSAVQYHEYN